MSANRLPRKPTWPLSMRAQYDLVSRNPGIHYWFPDGKHILSDKRSKLSLPKPVYDGWTLRFFIYAAGKNGGFYGVYMATGFGNRFSLRLHVSDGVVTGTRQMRVKTDDLETTTVPGNVAQGDIYTVSIDLHGDKVLKAYLNNTYAWEITSFEVSRHDYKLWVNSAEHLVLSMHFSRERGSRTHFEWNLYLPGLKVKVGSYVVQEFTFNGRYPDIAVHIRQKNKKETNHVFKTKGKLQPGERVRCTVRIIPGMFVVSMSFEPRPQLLTPDPNHLMDDQLEIWFSDNTDHTKAHFYCPE